ncbi:uncharacterized protein Dwil_GK20826 [Drosophila willistoni]|uniref:Ig-like domain-containing protein n=1 Tax=Drosophila willistoni TaxID=7260 RepID=B4MJG5_DROWI|nr:uncharacterized protein LOC6638432 [Drosophila willistoni]EDW72254.2 uncharacterized protein Dwil_GK20826 [Drosophila willistoni]
MLPNKANCLMAGLVLLLTCSQVFSYPQSFPDDDQMQADDDFEYDTDDQSAPSQQNKPANPTSTKHVSQQETKTVKVTGVLGKDVVLKCDLDIDSKSEVLWYFGNNVVTTGHNVVQTNFKVDANYDLTILRASPKDAGDYHCELLPQKSVLNIHVILNEHHSLDAIAPESSTSAASQSSWISGHTMAMWLLLLTARILLQH